MKSITNAPLSCVMAFKFALMVAIFASNSTIVLADDSGAEETIRLILARQKGDELNVYLNSRGTYVNGKSIKSSHLEEIIQRMKPKRAKVSAESYLAQEKVDKVTQLIQKSGVKKVSQVAVKRDWKAEHAEKMRVIVDRQRGEELKVHLNSRGKYVNGKSISSNDLKELIDTISPSRATVSAQSYLAQEKIDTVMDLIRESGVKNVNHVVIKRNLEAEHAEKLRMIVARQRGDDLKVYLNSRGVYVNGKSIKAADLEEVIRQMEAKSATVTAESYLADEKVTNIVEMIKKFGVSNVKQTTPSN